MGLSQSAVFAVLGVCLFIIIELFSGVLFSTVSEFNSSGNNARDRSIDEIHSKINITGITDGWTGTWWNTSFPFRKLITISPAKFSGPNYQVQLTIGCSSGGDFDLEGNSHNFPHDLRFIDHDNTTELSYWIENMSADPITAWIKIPDTLNTTWKNIYVYYGNSSVSTTRNGTNTFLFFDDFETSLSKWETSTQCSSAHVERNNTRSTDGDWSVYVYTTDVNCRARLNCTPTTTTDVVVEYDWAPKAGLNEYQTFSALTAKGGTSLGNLYAAEDVTPFNFQYYTGVGLVTLAAEYTENTEWHFIQEFYDFSSSKYDIYIDDTLQKDDAPFVGAGSSIGFITFQSGAGGDYGHQFIDSFRIRKWTGTTEPSFFSAKQEETILLKVTVENTGSINLKTSDFFILVNGTLYHSSNNHTENRCTCDNSYLFPLNEITIYTTTQAPSGLKRIKVVTNTGAEDYYQYGG